MTHGRSAPIGESHGHATCASYFPRSYMPAALGVPNRNQTGEVGYWTCALFGGLACCEVVRPAGLGELGPGVGGAGLDTEQVADHDGGSSVWAPLFWRLLNLVNGPGVCVIMVPESRCPVPSATA